MTRISGDEPKVPFELVSLDDIGRALAQARRLGTIADLRLGRIGSDAMAEDVQDEAFAAAEDRSRGYITLGMPLRAGQEDARDEMVYGPLLDRAVLEPTVPFRLPSGMLGARIALLFVLGRAYPRNEPISRASVASAVVRCDLAIELLGRRVPGYVPLNTQTATADYALHVATFRGSAVDPHLAIVSDRSEIVFSIDGQPMRRAPWLGSKDEGLDNVARLATALAKRGRGLEAGDLVSTGSRLPPLQVLPGQTLCVDGPTTEPTMVRLI